VKKARAHLATAFAAFITEEQVMKKDASTREYNIH
jgi:hypothetical protein